MASHSCASAVSRAKVSGSLIEPRRRRQVSAVTRNRIGSSSINVKTSHRKMFHAPATGWKIFPILVPRRNQLFFCVNGTNCTVKTLRLCFDDNARLSMVPPAPFKPSAESAVPAQPTLLICAGAPILAVTRRFQNCELLSDSVFSDHRNVFEKFDNDLATDTFIGCNLTTRNFQRVSGDFTRHPYQHLFDRDRIAAATVPA